jgi:hypothetical protein
MLARYYSSSLGRFMAADPLSGYLEKPQSLNKYTYTVNNPLKYTDPKGLDFYLTDDKGKKVKGGDACSTDGSCDKKGNLIVKSSALNDPESGYSGTVNENGVQITGGQGAAVQGTYTAQFIAKTPAADLQGSGAFEGFSFNIDGIGRGGRAMASGTFTFNGDPSQTQSILFQRGGYQSGADTSGWSQLVHEGTSIHFGTGPSPHFTIPRGGEGGTSTTGEFHVDKDAPGLKHFVGCFTFGIDCR